MTSTADSGTGSLRTEIGLANSGGGFSTIVFNTDSALVTNFSTPQTITLTSGALELSKSGEKVTITGPAAGVTVSGGGQSRVFQVDAGVTASISGLTITGGSAAYGAGLANLGTADLSDCTISGNSSAHGGGIQNALGTSNLTVTDCTLSGNSSQYGGALGDNGTATLIGCTFASNTASNMGGGVLVFGGDGTAIGDSA